MPRVPKFTKTSGHPVWHGLPAVKTISYRCGYCGDKVSSDKGFSYTLHGSGSSTPAIVICPNCEAPTFVYPDNRELFPAPSIGQHIQHVPADISALYDEARGCATGSHFTACVLLCRKILMHIGVNHGAATGLTFMAYVDHLANAGFVPPNGRIWVDHIRKKGNEANHEIVLMNSQDAKELVGFIEMLLRFIYEFPNSIPPSP